MSTQEMESKVKELRELRRMAEELSAEIETLQDAIKAEMTTRNAEELTGSDWRITWKNITSSRLDTAALRKELPEVAAYFTKETKARRFVLA